MTSKQQLSEVRQSQKHVLLSRNCLAVVLNRNGAPDVSSQPEDGYRTFADFLQQNSLCFWNACLTRSVATLEYRGYLIPCTLLVSGTDFALEVIRSAWARRVLRPPKGYGISKLGDVGSLEMSPASQTQFAPLSEALCKVVADLNSDRIPATAATLGARLRENFPGMQVPCEDILYKTLGGLIKERKLYHTGGGYFVVSPDTYRQRAVSPLCERQMLMTNEEAIVRLHGSSKECSLAIQVDEMDIAAAWKCSTSSFLHASKRRDASCQSAQGSRSSDLQLLERSHSLKIMKKGRSKANDDKGGSFKENSSSHKKFGYLASEFSADNCDTHKSEKQSMLTKFFKRVQSLTEKSSKHVTFSAQFPPLDWTESEKMIYHSVATQTQLMVQKVCPKSGSKRTDATNLRMPWNDMDLFEKQAIPHYLSPISAHRKVLNHADRNIAGKNAAVPLRQNNSRLSPSQRYSYGAFPNHSKRRHKHRRSSSESPKVVKALMNNYQSTISKSPADQSEDKVYCSSSTGSALTCNSKEIKSSGLNRFDGTLHSNNVVSKSNIPLNEEIKNDGLFKETIDNKITPNIENNSKKPQVPKNITVPSKIIPTEEKKEAKVKDKLSRDSDQSLSASISDAKLALSESSDTSGYINSYEAIKKETDIPPLILKNCIDMPKAPETNKSTPKKEIIIDNSVSVELAMEKNPMNPKGNNISTTVVTEETTVTKGKSNSKVVTVTSITTSLSHGGIKDLDKTASDDKLFEQDICDDKEKFSVNNLNIENEKSSRIVDCSSSCNIVTEVK